MRLNVDNPGGRLKPDMFVSAAAHAVLTAHDKVVDVDLAGKWMCPMHPEVIADGLHECSECGMALVPAVELGFVSEPGDGESLVIPHTAPLVTGRRAVVYVRLPDRAEPTFEGREILLGPRAGRLVHRARRAARGGGGRRPGQLQARQRAADPRTAQHDEPGPRCASGGGAARDAAGVRRPARARPGSPRPSGSSSGRSSTRTWACTTRWRRTPRARDRHRRCSRPWRRSTRGPLEADARAAWRERLPGLRDAARELAAAPDVDERRVRLAPLTEHLAAALATFGFERAGGAVGVFHCPMALDGRGADWIQQDADTANPYFGAQMPRCGSRRTRLVPER